MANILTAIALVGSVTTLYGLPVPTSQQYSHSEQLDSEGKYTVYWAYNDTHITFEVHVQTHGYVGFGISPNGKMYPSDVVIGWVKDGNTHFSDRHTTAHAPPELDTSQDWFLIEGKENEFGTILKFVRKLDTCDKDDLPITAQTIRLIYSYHPDDPESETSLLYHGAERRGAKSVSLLSSSLPPASFENEDVRILEFRNRNYLVPSRHTTYSCTGIELPRLDRKYHVIEYEQIITPGNEHNVHHMIVSRCNGSYPHLDMKTAICDDSKNEMQDWPNGCTQFALWAVGGGPFYFPANTGYPIGDDGSTFFIIEIHYDNPTQRADIIDSSGMRVKLTSNLRQHDVGTLTLAHETSKRQVIPPQETDFITRGYCAHECTDNGLTGMPDEVKVISAAQHSHLLGTGVTTRHFRNGVELEPIMNDPYYDFNFQSMRPLTKERVIKPGDSFIVECTLNTMDRVNTSFGGLSTHEEMCITFMFVYPQPPLKHCSSAPVFDTYNLTATTSHAKRHELYQKFTHMNWNAPGAKADFRQRLHDSTVEHLCVYKRNGHFSVNRYNFVETVTPFNQTQHDSQTCHS